MKSQEQMVIELSRGKLTLIIFGAIAFVVMGIFMIFDSSTLISSIGIAGVVFFGSCAIFGVKKLLEKSPGLILSKDGFTDNSSGVSVGYIPWSDVIEVKEYQLLMQMLVSIRVRNPEEYVNRGNLLQRIANRINLKVCGTPINISANSLQIGYEELLSTFEEYFDNSRNISRYESFNRYETIEKGLSLEKGNGKLTRQEMRDIDRGYVFIMLFWVGMIIALGVYVVIANVIGEGVIGDKEPSRAFLLVGYLLYFYSLLMLIFAHIVRKAIPKQHSTLSKILGVFSMFDITTLIFSGGKPFSAMGRYMGGMMVCFMLCLTVGIFGLVLFLIKGDFLELYILIGIAAIASYYIRPNKQELINLAVRLKWEDQEVVDSIESDS